jgi:hypothetical protein
MHVRYSLLGLARKYLWLIIGGIVCLSGIILLSALITEHGGSPNVASANVASATPVINPSSIGNRQIDESAKIDSVTPEPAATPENKSVFASPANKETVDVRRKMVGRLNTELRDQTRKLYGVAFQQLGLSADVQEKVLDILTKQQQELEQKAFEAAQTGTLPDLPSFDEIRAQKAEQEQELRSVLGDDGYTQFAQYQASIPDRMIVNELNQEGGNLSQAQSAELLQVLAQVRQQIFDHSGTMPDINSISPGQAMAVIKEQQALLQQTVNSRVQNILTPDQQTVLAGVLSRLNNVPISP